MTEIKRLMVPTMSLLLLVGCAEKAETKKSAPAAPREASSVSAAAVPASPAPVSGQVVALPFTVDTSNTVQGGPTVAVIGAPASMEQAKFGRGCIVGDGAALAINNLPMTAEGTWALWVHPNAKQAEAHVRILDANAYGIFLNGSKIAIAYNDGRSVGLPGPDITPEQWTHLAMTWGEGSLKLYVNGQLHGQRVIKGPPAFPKRRLIIGARWTAKGMSFSGGIDDVAIFDRAISAEEVAQLAEKGLE